MLSREYHRIFIVLVALVLLWPTTIIAVPMVFEATDDITDEVNAFRAVLGEPLNGNAPGPLPAGRREINWDGGGNNENTAVAGNPFAGFQLTRGALFTTPDGTGFVQAPPAADPALFPPGGLAGLFNNPTYGTIFSTFSPLRLFTPIESNITEVDFFVPGGDIPATITGFGAVFTDVDLPDSTMLEFFDFGGRSLFSEFVDPDPQGLSFLGALFPDAVVSRVRITSGNTPLGPDDDPDSGVDVVVMDDFLYSEPAPIPEPGTLILLATGLGGLLGYGWRRQKPRT